MENGHNEKIEELFNKAIGKYDDNNFNEAISIFEEILKEDRDNIKAIENIGACYGKLGNNEKALEKFNEALALANDKNDEESIINVTINKILSLVRLKEYKQIITFATETIDKVNTSEKYNGNKLKSDLLNYIGIANYYLNNYEESIKKYDYAIKLYPYNTSAYKNKGLSLEKLGKREEAQSFYNRSVVVKEGIDFKAYIQALSGRTFAIIMNTKYQCIILDFLDIFSNIEHSNKTIIFTATHKMDNSMRNKINSFKEKYRFYSNNEKNIEVQALYSRFKQIEDNDFFVILPEIVAVDSEKAFEITLHLMEELGEDTDSIRSVFYTEHTLYNIEPKSRKYAKNHFYGEKDKNKRICKYCNNNNSDTSFKEKAHIIPKSLGNNNLFDNEECDNCNHKFASSIEEDLNSYLAPFKTIFKVKGYGGKVPDFNNKEGEYIKLIDNKIEMASKHVEEDENGLPKVIKFHLGKINMQNFYRALVKMALGFIPYKDVREHFIYTVEWINLKSINEKLPPVIMFFNHNRNVEIPILMVLYIRKNKDDKQYPYLVAELYFYQFTFNYIIPFSDYDNIDFADMDIFNEFHKKWHTYKAEYKLIDCNKDKKIDISLQIDLKNMD